MKRRFALIALAFLLVFTCIPASTTASAEIKVVVDGKQLDFPVPPTIINSKTMVPMREIFEALGAEVHWDGATKTVTGIKGSTQVQLTLNQKHAFKNGHRFELQVAAQLVNGKTMVPIRFISESLGAQVDWDGATKTVIITSPKTVPDDGKDDMAGDDEGPPLLTVHCIDVGQGDSVFIDYGDYDILIDGGDNAYGPVVVNYLEALNTDDIEILVATHPHADHIGGLDDVLTAFTVERIIDSGTSSNSQTFSDYMAAIEAEKDAGAEFIYDDNMTFTISDGITFEVIETGDDYDEVNDNSVVCRLDYGDVEFLFTGDMESDIEQLILDKDIRADVLKVGHHGSDTSTSDAFLSAVQPKAAVISVGAGNRYGHPHLFTLQRLLAHDVEIYMTSAQGTIVVTTDGQNYQFNVQSIQDTATSETEQGQEATTEQEQTETANVVITNIDLVGEVVTIKNTGDKDVDMTGWKLVSVVGNQTFYFPAGFVLKAGASVQIRSGRGATGDGVNSLVWTNAYIWNNDGDPGQLYDAHGDLVSQWP